MSAGVARTISALLALVALGWWLFGREPLPAVADLPRASQVLAHPQQAQRGPATRAATPAVASREGVSVASPQQIAPSLEGAAIDGEVALAADGHLRIDAALRRYFDWHRAASGEIGEAGLRDWLASNLAQHLPATAVAEALDLYDRYLDYLRAADQLAAMADPLERLDALFDLRHRWFGVDVAAALFADEDRWLQVQVERDRIRNRAGSDREQRARELRALEASLPAEFRPDPVVALVDEVQRLDREFDAAGLDAAERLRERSALFGEAGAQRLAVLDQQRASWDQRLADYQSESARLRQQYPDTASWQFALESWAREHYSDAELRRIAALEAVAREGKGP